MFYFLLPTLMSYDFILVIAAVVPAVFLMIKVYRSDRLEKESPAMLWSLMRAGIFSSLIALVEERILGALLDLALPDSGVLYNVILYFGIVAFAEESSKYIMLKRRSWNSPEFNCQYDGVVYAVFVSLGFALWENISYVLNYGFSVAVVRAVTAKACRVLAVFVPALMHGMYDYIASADLSTWYFVGFIAVLFIVSYILVGKMSKEDWYI